MFCGVLSLISFQAFVPLDMGEIPAPFVLKDLTKTKLDLMNVLNVTQENQRQALDQHLLETVRCNLNEIFRFFNF